MSPTEHIKKKLLEAFKPDYLELVDNSDSHKGHRGYREGGETHFKLIIVSSAFEDMKRLERQRMIYNTLEYEMNTSIHALSIQAFASSEYCSQK